MQRFLSRRMSRGPYWLLVLLNSVVALLLIWTIGFAMRHLMVDGSGRPHLITELWLLNPLVPALLHLPILIGTIWRLHDTGHRSWPVWLLFLYLMCLTSFAYLGPPIVRSVRLPGISGEQAIMLFYGFYGFQLVLSAVMIRTIYLCCLRGDTGSNEYGPPTGGESPIIPSGPEETGEAQAASVAPSVTAPPPVRIAPPQKRAFGRRAG
jgi:uncharacterized membrane protein YhaH (DUF805 family)